MVVEIRKTLRAECSASRLYSWVDDLAIYPQWMTLIHEVESAATVGDETASWNVELQARVGPFARSKRLRMTRTVHELDQRVVFERAEVDGRTHSPWILQASVTSLGPGSSELVMELHYGGSLWSGIALQRVLDDEVVRGSETLSGLVSREPTR